MNAKGTRKLEQMVVAAALVSGLSAGVPASGGDLGAVENASLDTGLFARTFGAEDESFRVASRLGRVRGGEVLDDVRGSRGRDTRSQLSLPMLGMPSFARMVPTAFSLTGGIERFLKRPDYGQPRYFWEKDADGERQLTFEAHTAWPDYSHLFPAWEMHLRMHSDFVANAIVPHLTPPGLQYRNARGQVTLSSRSKDEPPAQRSKERDR